MSLSFFFVSDPATTEIYTLSLHDALPICRLVARPRVDPDADRDRADLFHPLGDDADPDRKSTRRNSSHANISYAVFCLKKKKQNQHHPPPTTETQTTRSNTHHPAHTKLPP